MQLRFKADRRTVAYMIVTTLLLFAQWNLHSFNIVIYIISLFFAISVAVIAHNHNHLPIWRSKLLNTLTDYWLTLFYGFPAFAWIPTHNSNHHKLNNKEGDYTITYRVSEKNNLLTLMIYPAISSYFQQKPIRDYLKVLKEKDRKKYYLAVFQYVALVSLYAIALIIDWKKALLYIAIPHQVSLFSVLVFNYIQHVHADEESAVDHSRNFTGLLNKLLFNNGYHTVHHERAGLHWSETPAAHAKIAHKIDPSLIEPSFWGYIGRAYFLGAFFKKKRTVSRRLQRIENSPEVHSPAMKKPAMRKTDSVVN